MRREQAGILGGAALLCGSVLLSCGAGPASEKPEAPKASPRTALEKRAALLNREPTALEKDVEKFAEVVRRQIAPFGYSLDEEWNVLGEGKGDPACRSASVNEEVPPLFLRAMEQGERLIRLRLSRLQLALTTCESGFDSNDAHRARMGMGVLLIQLGKPLAARKAFEEELAWAEARYGRDSEQVATVLLRRNADLWGSAVLSEAYAFFEEHRDTIEKYFPQSYRSTIGAFGTLSCDSGRTSLALQYAQRMMRSYDPARHAEEGYAISVAQIAGCLKRKGEEEESERLFSWALLKQRNAEAAQGDPSAWASLQVLNENGLLFEARGDFSGAEREYARLEKRALADGLKKEPGPISGLVVTAWVGQARAQFEQGKVEAAARSLKKLRQLPSEMYIDALGPKVQRALGRYDQALSELDTLEARSQGWGEWIRLSFALERARVLWAKGSFRKARDIFQESLALGLAHLDVRSGGSESERLRAISHVRPAVDALVSMNVRSGPKDAAMTEEAFSSLLLTKGVLLDALSADFSKLRESRFKEDVELLQRLQQLRSSLAQRSIKDREGAFFDQRLELETLEARARERSRILGGDPKPITPRDVRASLDEGETFIEFVDFEYEDPKKAAAKPEKHIAAYVVKRRGPIRVFDLGPSRDLTQAVEAARAELAPGHSKAASKLKKLGALVFGPLESSLGGTHTLRLAPDGTLARIPFSALRDSSGKYYLERFLITYIGTGREWARLAKTRTTTKARPGSMAMAQLSPLIVANPEFGAQGRAQSGAPGTSPFTLSTRGQQSIGPIPRDWQALPGTADEARQLAALFPQGNILTHQAATEAAVKAVAHPDILHIASHGYFLPPTTGDGTESVSEDPLLHAGLVLAFANAGGRGSEDGFLTALEVTGLDLGGTQVATLSACETGLGEINGEGVFGLRRSLAIAGAESQLLSLWKVSDDATQRLMTEFYKRIARGESRQAALTSVQRSMAQERKFRHPYYWSAFVLSGDPGVLRLKE